MSDIEHSADDPQTPQGSAAEGGPDEREQVEQLAQAHAALAAAQDRSYWLDRWEVDLNGLMRRPSARRVRAALRLLRELKRGAVTAERYAQRRLDTLRATASEDEMAAAAPIREANGTDAAGEREPSSDTGSARP